MGGAKIILPEKNRKKYLCSGDGKIWEKIENKQKNIIVQATKSFASAFASRIAQKQEFHLGKFYLPQEKYYAMLVQSLHADKYIIIICFVCALNHRKTFSVHLFAEISWSNQRLAIQALLIT